MLLLCSRLHCLCRCARLQCTRTATRLRQHEPTLLEKLKNVPPASYIILVIPGMALWLCIWQIRRKQWKETLLRELHIRTNADPVALPDDLSSLNAMEYYPITVRGTFDHSRELIVFPRSRIHDNYAGPNVGGHGPRSIDKSPPMAGGGANSGGYVITPFKLADRDVTILINRGWVPRGKFKPTRRQEAQVTGVVDIVGLVRKTEPKGSRMANVPEKGWWYYRDVEALAELLGTKPVFLDALDSTTIHGGPIGGQTHLVLPNDHASYAMTWFCLFLATSFMFYFKFLK